MKQKSMISEIIDNIYIGSWNDAKNYQQMFDIIFTVAFDSPFRGNYYYNIRDGGDTDYNELIKSIFDLYYARRTNKNSKILVHCVSGYSRSSVVVAGYIMLEYHLLTHDAINIIKSRRDIGINNPNPGLINLLENSKELNNNQRI